MSKTRRDGFTLVEALVAMAIAAAGFAGLYQLLSGAAQLERSAQQVQSMTVVAESVLLRTPFMPAGQALQGAEGEYEWSISAIADPELATLSIVTVTVFSPDGRSLRLRSARPAQEQLAETEEAERR